MKRKRANAAFLDFRLAARRPPSAYRRAAPQKQEGLFSTVPRTACLTNPSQKCTICLCGYHLLLRPSQRLLPYQRRYPPLGDASRMQWSFSTGPRPWPRLASTSDNQPEFRKHAKRFGKPCPISPLIVASDCLFMGRARGILAEISTCALHHRRTRRTPSSAKWTEYHQRD